MGDERNLGALSALDWIAVALTGLIGLNLLLFPLRISPTYVAMFEDFGSEMPGLTRLVVQGWFPLLGLALVAGLQVFGLVRAMSLVKRRAVIVGCFLLALAWVGVCWLGLYQPIFDLAGAVA